MDTATNVINEQVPPSFSELISFLADKLGSTPANNAEAQQFVLTANGPEGKALVHGEHGCLGPYVLLVCDFHHIAYVEGGHRAVRRLLRAYNRQSVMGHSYLDPDGEVWLRRSVFLSAKDWRDQASFLFESSLHMLEQIQSMLTEQGGSDREVYFFDESDFN